MGMLILYTTQCCSTTGEVVKPYIASIGVVRMTLFFTQRSIWGGEQIRFRLKISQDAPDNIYGANTKSKPNLVSA